MSIAYPKSTFIIILLLVSFVYFWRSGHYSVLEWDEARNGVNAFEMLQTKDYVNLYYDQAPDTWNAKPPLLIWLISLSYQVFGFNEFALRFPVFLSILLFFFFFFKIITGFEEVKKALFCSLILIASKAILGSHIGLSGDFDMLLTAFLTGSVFYFIQYIEKGKKSAIFLVALTTGLAFYTKGPASFILLPGFFLYLLLQGKVWSTLKDKNTLLSISLFVAIVFSWVCLVYTLGKTVDQSHYGSKNAIETMLIHDTFRRITDYSFEQGANPITVFFFFNAIDVRLNLWNYLFYVGLFLGIKQLVSNRKNIIKTILNDKDKLNVLSICLILPISLVLSFAKNQDDWYLAPIFPYVAIIITQTIMYSSTKWKYTNWAFSILFLVTFSKHLYYISNISAEKHLALLNNKSLEHQEIVIPSHIGQEINLYLKWLDVKQIRVPNDIDFSGYSGKFVLYQKNALLDQLYGKIDTIQVFDEYLLGKFKH